jgi:hypothetical protein
MFAPVLAYEAKNLFIRRNIVILIAFFILLAAFSCEGTNDYKTILRSQKPFQETEKNKVSLFIHYTLYGIRGVRLMCVPCPLSVIFNDLAVYSDMMANVDTGEGLNIYNSLKGKELFSDSGGFMDFSGIMLLVGSFLALTYGYDSTRNREYLKLLADISGSKHVIFLILLARVILLSLVFLVLACLSLLWLLLNGINVVNPFFLWFVLGLILAAIFFSLLGAVVGSLKSKAAQLITLPVVYFAFLMLVPWLVQKAVYTEATKSLKSVHDIEYDMLKVMMKLEKRLYDRFGVWKSGKGEASEDIKSAIQSGLQNEYKKLQEHENKRLADISRQVNMYQTTAALFPTTFYLSVNKELSSKGFRNFIDFYKYAYEMKYRFIKFYIEKKFHNPVPKEGLEPFIKGKENLFHARSQLPESFGLGLGLSFLYIAGLLAALYRIQVKEPKKEIKQPQINFKKGENALLVLCQDDKVKSDIFRFYQARENTSCIDKITVGLDFRYISMETPFVVQYFCRLAGVDREKVNEYLSLLKLKSAGKDLGRSNRFYDDILKIYAAVKIAADREYVVLNDFFKMESRQLEEAFFKLLEALKASGKKILYLSCEMPYPKASLAEKINIRNFATFPLQFDMVTLR